MRKISDSGGIVIAQALRYSKALISLYMRKDRIARSDDELIYII
jgi:hypothetical protein